MARPLGFSTGALARGDFRRGLRMLAGLPVSAVELSALRDQELVPLLDALGGLDLAGFTHISVHAPSRCDALCEAEILKHLQTLTSRGWPLIVHPDVITNFAAWEALGPFLCIENMDKRKPTGRNVAELDEVFRKLPRATFCFDLGHARQVDPSMSQAALILNRFGNRLRQIHVSEVTSRSSHEPLTYGAQNAFRRIARLIPPATPIILETPVTEEEQIRAQLALVAEVFAGPLVPVA